MKALLNFSSFRAALFQVTAIFIGYEGLVTFVVHLLITFEGFITFEVSYHICGFKGLTIRFTAFREGTYFFFREGKYNF